MHRKHTDPAGHSDMGGGTDRAERGAARSWERQRRTGTALAAGLVVLGTLLVTGHRSGTGVEFGKASLAEPGTADTGAGQRECAIRPVGGEKNRHRDSR